MRRDTDRGHALLSVRLVATSLVLVLAGFGSLAGPTMAVGADANDVRLAQPARCVHSRDLPRLPSSLLGNSLASASDGRLTVLIVGSDHRYTRNIGERLDALIVATINPRPSRWPRSAFHATRATLPLPDPNDTYHGKVNSLLASLQAGRPTRATAALEMVRQTIAYALKIEIDYVVFNRFPGFDAMVDAIGGVNVDIPLEIRDPRIIDALGPPKGARFVAGTNVLEQGTSATKCYGVQPPIDWSLVMDCHHALIYVRSRHGKIGTAATTTGSVTHVSSSSWPRPWPRSSANGSGSALTRCPGRCAEPAQRHLHDSAYRRYANLLALFNLFNGAQNQPILSAVLKPNKYAHHVPGTGRYELKLDVVRALTAALVRASS